ncbi:MAG: hypothetical protein HKN82_03610 [Akkermansiaceae bacterium]|nr:hypothetical protein [Akkermansiaceae bacterium]
MKAITIAGGGLAGLALGIALRRRDVPVVLHEAGSYPRHRVCGEFINGVSEATLERLGIAGLFADARRHRSTRWFVEGEPIYDAELPEPAIGLSRYVLDERMAGEFGGLGGELRTKSRARPEAREGLVWAAGRRAERESGWLGLKVHVEGVPMEADLEMHVGEAGYLGLAPVEGERVNACGLFRRRDGVKGKGADLLWAYLEANGLHQLADRLREARCDERSFTGVSAFRLGRQDPEDGLCVLGDAESMIPPFTGNGMSMAFEAAEAAVQPAADYAAGAAGWDEAVMELRRRLRRRFRRRLFTARLLHPFLLRAAGRHALALTARTGLLPFTPLFRLLR